MGKWRDHCRNVSDFSWCFSEFERTWQSEIAGLKDRALAVVGLGFGSIGFLLKTVLCVGLAIGIVCIPFMLGDHFFGVSHVGFFGQPLPEFTQPMPPPMIHPPGFDVITQPLNQPIFLDSGTRPPEVPPLVMRERAYDNRAFQRAEESRALQRNAIHAIQQQPRSDYIFRK
jgi:hypothetical protein